MDRGDQGAEHMNYKNSLGIEASGCKKAKKKTIERKGSNLLDCGKTDSLGMK